jgi:putative tRNA adenosine deaminase-associated protein
MSDDTLTDFAVAVSRDEGRWDVAPLPTRAAHDLDALVRALSQLTAEQGVLGLVSVADDFFVALRVQGQDVRLLLSDASAATEWPLARDVLEALDLPMPDDDDDPDDSAFPAGDLDIFRDFGMPGMEVATICGDLDLYPDEMIGRIASRLGFAEQFESAVGA